MCCRRATPASEATPSSPTFAPQQQQQQDAEPAPPSIAIASQQQQQQQHVDTTEVTAAEDLPILLGPAVSLPQLQYTGPSDSTEALAPAWTPAESAARTHILNQADRDRSPAVSVAQLQPAGPSESTEGSVPAMTPEEEATHRRRLKKTELNRKSQQHYR